MNLIKKFYYGDIPDENQEARSKYLRSFPFRGRWGMGPRIGLFGKFLSAANRD